MVPGRGCVHAAWLDARGAAEWGGWARRWSPVEQIELGLDRRAFQSAERVIFNSEMARAEAVSRQLVTADQAIGCPFASVSWHWSDCHLIFTLSGKLFFLARRSNVGFAPSPFDSFLHTLAR